MDSIKVVNHRNPIGFGLAAIGRPSYINIRSEDSRAFSDIDEFRKNGIQILRQAIEMGVTHFDTAPGYGIAEEMLLEVLPEIEKSGISVSTKWGYTYVANFDPDAKQHEIKDHSLQKLNEQWEQSKQLLPSLRLYQIHSATPDSGVLDNMAILERLFQIKNEFGLVIGLSCSGANQNEVLAKALDILIDGEQLFNSFQVTFNVLDQSLLELRERLIHHTLIIKEGMANGRLLRNPAYPQYSALYAELEKLAAKYEVGPDAIALGFCRQSFEQAVVLSGASTLEQLQQNLLAGTFVLSPDEMDKLGSFAVSPEAYWNERKGLAWV